jgi:transposase InsO family protein
LVWHTDRGSQYASDSHRAILKEHSIIQSMSRKRETVRIMLCRRAFFHPLKTEMIYHTLFKTRSEAKQAIFEYIEVFYNRERIHSANDSLSPVEYEIQQKPM